MIKDSITALAMQTKAKGIVDSLGYLFIPSGAQVDDLAGASYVQEKMLVNTKDSVGLGGGSSDIQRPIYQLNVCTPKGESRYNNRDLVELITSQFNKAEYISNGNQSIQIQTVDTSDIMYLEAHLVTAISVNLTVLANNV